MLDEPSGELRIDDLARHSGVTVDTIRFYRREGLLPPAERVGRTKRYGSVHLERLEQIRELQERRFSLAAIKALLDEQPGIAEGIFAGGGADYTFAELVARSEVDAGLADRLRSAGLLRDPAEFGRDAYDAADLDLLRTVADLVRLGLPGDVIVELAAIYNEGVERMQSQVLELFLGSRGPTWKDPDELRAFQTAAAASAGELLPAVIRMVHYVHQRTLQRLTLGAIERGAGGNVELDAGSAPVSQDVGRLLARGRDGEIFEYGPGRVLRRALDGRNLEPEARIMAYVRDQGYPVPGIEAVQAGGSEIVMERIDGPMMMGAILRRPWTMPRSASVLADLHDQLHRIDAPDWLRTLSDRGHRVLHLDLHPLNVMLSRTGPVVIDWSNAARGEPLTDAALTYVLLTCPDMPGPRALHLAVQPVRTYLGGAFARRYRGNDFDAHLAFAAELKALDRNLSDAEATRCLRLAARARRRAGA